MRAFDLLQINMSLALGIWDQIPVRKVLTYISLCSPQWVQAKVFPDRSSYTGIKLTKKTQHFIISDIDAFLFCSISHLMYNLLIVLIAWYSTGNCFLHLTKQQLIKCNRNASQLEIILQSHRFSCYEMLFSWSPN